MIEIPANSGEPYRLKRTRSGLLRLSRVASTGSDIFLLIDEKAATGIADALIDAIEADN
ncbi:hypothetical protein [Mycobacterium aquaticum]|uniref:hypothetical protein n=1 Tax=Mycobacterium aquaticum TaxID=1927124 RepID=UPI001301DAC7|nr:hypothetical protein [Mycobacterium aquaticum]